MKFATPQAQCDLFEGWVYVMRLHKARHVDGRELSPKQFDKEFPGITFAMDHNNMTTTTRAWRAFTLSQAIRPPMVLV